VESRDLAYGLSKNDGKLLLSVLSFTQSHGMTVTRTLTETITEI